MINDKDVNLMTILQTGQYVALADVETKKGIREYLPDKIASVEFPNLT